jgi:ABC-type xylose transport system permease subunit
VAELNALETAKQGDAAKSSSWRVRRLLTEWRQLGIVVALVVTVLVFTAIDHDFFSGYNFVNIFLHSSITADSGDRRNLGGHHGRD